MKSTVEHKQTCSHVLNPGVSIRPRYINEHSSKNQTLSEVHTNVRFQEKFRQNRKKFNYLTYGETEIFYFCKAPALFSAAN